MVVLARVSEKCCQPVAGSVFEVTTPGELEDLFAGSGEGRGGGGEFALILIIDRNRFAEDRDRFDAWHPIEIRIEKKGIISF